PRFSSVSSLARKSREYISSPRRAISSAVNVGCGIIIASFQGIRFYYTDTVARLHRKTRAMAQRQKLSYNNPTTSLIYKSFNFNKMRYLYVKRFNSFCLSNPFNFNEL